MSISDKLRQSKASHGHGENHSGAAVHNAISLWPYHWICFVPCGINLTVVSHRPGSRVYTPDNNYYIIYYYSLYVIPRRVGDCCQLSSIWYGYGWINKIFARLRSSKRAGGMWRHVQEHRADSWEEFQLDPRRSNDEAEVRRWRTIDWQGTRIAVDGFNLCWVAMYIIYIHVLKDCTWTYTSWDIFRCWLGRGCTVSCSIGSLTMDTTAGSSWSMRSVFWTQL